MGFHKRWINKDSIISRFNYGGLDEVKSYFSADALLIEDNFSDEVYKMLLSDSDEDLIKLLNEYANTEI